MVAWHALATRPTLFRGYLIVDGSVFWNHGQVVDEVERALKSATPPPARVFWVRDAIPHEVWFPENHRLKALVDTPPSPVTHITFHEEPNETHGTVVYPGTYLGLKGLFADYRAAARPRTRPSPACWQASPARSLARWADARPAVPWRAPSAAIAPRRSSRTPSPQVSRAWPWRSRDDGFDAIVVGAGQAGPPLAGRLTSAGMTVALVERKLFGGTCVNTGCMPTKTLVASAHAAHLARRAAEFGVMLGGDIRIDMARVKARADAVSAGHRGPASRPGCVACRAAPCCKGTRDSRMPAPFGSATD